MNRKIALIADNSTEYVKVLFDIWNQGDCAVLIDWRIPWLKIKEMLTETEVSFCYVDEHKTADIVDENIPYQVINSAGLIYEINTLQYDLKMDNNSEEEALILFSSGTTGKSKGVVLTYYDINNNSDMVIDYMKPRKNERMLIIKTLAHSSTVICELLVAVKRKMKLYVVSTAVPMKLVVNYIDYYQINVCCMNPSLLKIMCEYVEKKDRTFVSLSTVYVSGAILSRVLLDKAKTILKKVNIYNVYGLTECGPRVAAQTKIDAKIPGSVGKPLKGIVLEIRDDNNVQLEGIEKGVIWVKTPTIFLRYVNKKRKLDERGFFCTNDIGFLQNGELVITGRKDNMISIGSHNVFPEEVEEIVHMKEGVEDCVVIGVEDAVYGQKLICVYKGRNIYATEFRKHCMNYLAIYEIPTVFLCVDEIPKNNNGKIQRDKVYLFYKQIGE